MTISNKHPNALLIEKKNYRNKWEENSDLSTWLCRRLNSSHKHYWNCNAYSAWRTMDWKFTFLHVFRIGFCSRTRYFDVSYRIYSIVISSLYSWILSNYISLIETKTSKVRENNWKELKLWKIQGVQFLPTFFRSLL